MLFIEEVTMSKINNALKVCFFVLVALVVLVVNNTRGRTCSGAAAC